MCNIFRKHEKSSFGHQHAHHNLLKGKIWTFYAPMKVKNYWWFLQIPLGEVCINTFEEKKKDIQSRETESFWSHIQVTHSTSMCSVAYRASTKSLQIALFWDEDDTNILYLFKWCSPCSLRLSFILSACQYGSCVCSFLADGQAISTFVL